MNRFRTWLGSNEFISLLWVGSYLTMTWYVVVDHKWWMIVPMAASAWWVRFGILRAFQSVLSAFKAFRGLFFRKRRLRREMEARQLRRHPES